MWNILIGTWKYDPLLRLPLLSIATLLDQLKEPDLTSEVNIKLVIKKNLNKKNIYFILFIYIFI